MPDQRFDSSSFRLFLLLNACFLGLQLLLTYSIAGSFVSSIRLPWGVYWELIQTLSVHIALYVLLSLIQTLLLSGILRRRWHYFPVESWQLIVWFLCTCAILCANTYYFPLSSFSKLISPPVPESLILILLILSTGALIGLLLTSFNRNTLGLLIIGFTGYCIFVLNNNSEKPLEHAKPNRQPDIIILGIDSLSPESVTPKSMPFLYKQLYNSVQFTNAISPLARTFPAWCSILTGLYPHNHHADENLVDKDLVKSNASMVWILNKLGYSTLFASDDRRFSSIDEQFGFKKVLGPKLGINDVLLGSFNDLPLSNLLINFSVSAWLFPYNYMNRASFFSYYPETFTSTVEKELSNLENRRNPVFLTVHLTLPHWPYAWAESLPEQVNNEYSLEKRDVLYQNALQKVDRQFQSLFSYLQAHHFFNNSLVLILSDHGEVLYHSDSRLTNYQNYRGTLPSKLDDYFKSRTATVLNKSAGHGSDILSPGQYHSIVAFRVYKNGRLLTQKAEIRTRIALIDIAPTIMDFIRYANAQKMDGISLLESIQNPGKQLEERSFYIESGMLPNQNISKQKAIQMGQKFYRVNPETRELEIKPAQLKQINRQKLYGIIDGPWILALYPDQGGYISVIQNLDSGQWIDDLESDFAKSTPAARLSQQLRRFYADILIRKS